MIFNEEISARLRDLNEGDARFSLRPAFQHQPAHVLVEIGDIRKFALSLELAALAADQLEVNGQATKALALRECIP